MLIQRVVIQGFKTFAKRTEFVFDPGITAVVGPNGSGKSNIVDAVRWCLGEQSFSLLRSKKTSDIIFSGSDKRARLGMAQVSLVLDNSGGEIPIDFNEVEITRRAYRDGDNEYLVNGQKVRLADVTQLLAQTGLGKRTYAVIGQGLIDRVLSLAPEERRSLFEEAAGISGYQAKREAALRRLDATQANLVRVRDITAELAPRLGYLKRQAERAREREQMATDLRGMLREWYGYKWHKALTEVEDHHADARILKNGIDDRQLILDTLAARIEGIRLRQVELRALLNEHHRAASGLHRDAERVSRELAVASERTRQAQERSEEIQRELSPLRMQHDALVERLAGLRAGVEEAERALIQERSTLQTTNHALEQQRLAQEKTQSALDRARAELASTQARLADAQSRLRQLSERELALQAARARHESTTRDAATQENDLRTSLRAAEAAHAEMEARAATLNSTISTVNAQRDQQRAQLDAAESKRRDADREADRLQTRYDLLRRLSNEGAGMHSGVRAIMQAKLPGVLGVVASLLRVPPELDKAVEMALGGALQNLVAATWADAQHAIEYLKSQQRGRATFLPLDRLNVLPAIPAPRMEGVLGNAADLIACDPEIEVARDQLLNRIWIVQDLPTARHALDALRGGSRPTVVTLGGEIVRPGGAVTGGSDNSRGDESSMLQRERELRALPAQVESALVHARTSTEACRTFAAGSAAAAVQLDESQRALAELTRQERTQQSALAELRRASDRAQQQSAYTAQQLAAFEAEAATLQMQRAMLETALPTFDGTRLAAEQRLTEAQNAHVLGGGAELLHTLADQRAAEALAQGTLNSRRALVEQQVRSIAQVRAQIETKEARSAQLGDEGKTTAKWLGELTAQEQALSAQLAIVQQAITPHEAEIVTLERAQIGTEGEERAVQQLQRRDETAWSHAQIALQRSQDVVAQLQADIQRDLGLVDFEENTEVSVQPPLPLEAYVEALPVRERLAEGLEDEVIALRTRLARLTNVNPEAPREYDEAAARYTHLTTQADDLDSAAADLHKIIRNLDDLMQSELTRTFAAVAIHFQLEFQKLFNGGTGELVLTDPANIAETGIEIIARPPGKRPQSLALLSGGERSLAACALIFAILRVSPTPFCVLDEVDAALDEANVDRFRLAVEDLSHSMQFIIVTHNRRTLEGANTIYGITMGNDSVSKAISLRLDGDHIVHNHGAFGNGSSNDNAKDAPSLEDAPGKNDVNDAIAELDELVRM